MTPPFEPVRTVADLDTLAIDDVVAGYWAGLAGEPEPGHNRGRSFWHGWRNGMMDAGRMPKDDAAAALAWDVVGKGRLREKSIPGNSRHA